MIACPICGSDTRVTETRKTGDGVRRRRRCAKLACTGKFTTVEVVVPSIGCTASDLVTEGAVMVSKGALARLRKAVAGLGGVP